MGTLKIERTGGFAGFGGPHLKSRGEVAFDSLSPTDQAAVDALFSGGNSAKAGSVTDGFSYRITRTVKGKTMTVTVPESRVPMSVQSQVKDMLE